MVGVLGAAQYQRPLLVDVNGVAVVNSAGDPFDPPIEVDDCRPELSITRVVLDSSTVVLPFSQVGFRATAYENTINNADVTIDNTTYGTGKLKIAQYSADRLVVGGVTYWRETIKIQFRDETWQLKIVDQGYRKKVTAPSPRRRM